MRAYSIPTLPAKVENYYKKRLVRIFRFIGRVSFWMVATNTNFYLQLPKIVHLLCLIVACIHVTHVIIILLIKFFFCLYILIFERKRFEVRNSPLNSYATIISQVLYCLKYGCVTTGSVFAGDKAYDSLLAEYGRERVTGFNFEDWDPNASSNSVSTSSNSVSKGYSLFCLVRSNMNQNTNKIILEFPNRQIRKISTKPKAQPLNG